MSKRFVVHKEGGGYWTVRDTEQNDVVVARWKAKADPRKRRRKSEPGHRTTLDDGSTSVRTVSAGGFETRRRKH